MAQIDRRRFLAASGAAIGAVATLGAAVPASAGEPAATTIDPDALAETAYRHFIPGGMTCAESILLAGSEALGMSSDLMPQIAIGLGGGVGLQGGTCGILTGGALVIALAASRREADEGQRKRLIVKHTGSLYAAFREEAGKTDCRSLTGLDLTTPEGRQQLGRTVKSGTCANYLRLGAKLLGKELQALT